MGWTGVHKPKHQTAINLLKEGWAGSEDYEIVDTAMKGYNIVAFAVRSKIKDYVFAVVYMIQFSNEHYNFHYKDMSEFAGPNILCPKKILKLLTPLEEIAEKDGESMEESSYQWAKNWRERSAKLYDKPKIQNGDIIKIDREIKFMNGESYQYFRSANRKFYAVIPVGDEFRTVTKVSFNPRKENYTVVKKEIKKTKGK